MNIRRKLYKAVAPARFHIIFGYNLVRTVGEPHVHLPIRPSDWLENTAVPDCDEKPAGTHPIS